MLETSLAWAGTLEIRQDGERPILTAKFPLNVVATVNNKGRRRKEVFRTGSMGWQVKAFQQLQQELADVVASEMAAIAKEARVMALEDALEKRNTHLLIGHDYNRAIADMKTGTLAVRETSTHMELEAGLPMPDQQASWVKDAALAVKGGQLRGVSPGFQVTERGSERLIPEEGPGTAMMREILDSTVFEYSLVARPSYPFTEVDTRSDELVIPRRRRYWL